MNAQTVVFELRESAKAIADRIEDGTRTGKIIISLLEVAENGGFR